MLFLLVKSGEPMLDWMAGLSLEKSSKGKMIELTEMMMTYLEGDGLKTNQMIRALQRR